MTSRRRLIGLASVAALAVVAWTAGGPAAAQSLARFVAVDAVSATVATGTLAPPTNLVAVGLGTSVVLTWTPTVSTWASGYDLRRAGASGGPYSSIASLTPATVAATTDAPSSGTWYYVLRSQFASWASADSGEASASVLLQTSTAFAACASQAADTAGAGDNNGYEGNPARACTDDSLDATDSNSGTGGTESCGTGATPDARKDRHRFWGFATGVPGTVTSVDGIRVRADLGLNNNGGTTNVCAQLSSNGGSTWTTLQPIAVTRTEETTYVFGGEGDTWGRAWTASELSSANFRVRLVNASTQTNKRFDLDVVMVSVTYTP